MARMNISIQDELKKRMDTHKGVNWSQTASDAFENKINQINSTLKVKNMTEAISRLNASKANLANEVEKQGHQDGMEWAMTKAEYVELQRISDCIKSTPYPEDLKTLEYVITEDAYSMEFRDNANDDSYIEGFINGSMEVLEKVDAS